MRVIDRYILREFVRNFLASLAFFTALILIVRFSEKEMGRFVSSMSTSILSMLYQTPRYVVQVAPPSVLFATFFSLGRMSQNNEIAAMKAAGISLYRVFLPVFIAAFLIALLMIGFNDQLVSRANRKAAEAGMPDSRDSRITKDVVFTSTGGRVFHIYLIYPGSRQMRGLTMYEFDDDNNVQRVTFAREAFWNGKTWHLTDGIERILRENKWDEAPFERMEITVNEDPEIMIKGTRDLREMSVSELLKLVKYKRAAGQTVRKVVVSLHDKISFPFACFIMALLGAPLFVVFGRSGTAVGFLLTMFISFLYWGIAIAVFEAFGNNGKLPPLLSCWTANFLFMAVGAVFVYKVKK